MGREPSDGQTLIWQSFAALVEPLGPSFWELAGCLGRHFSKSWAAAANLEDSTNASCSHGGSFLCDRSIMKDSVLLFSRH